MRKNLQHKILAAVMAAGSLCLYAAAPAAAANYTVTDDGEIISSGTYTNVYGNGHSFTINGGEVTTSVYGIGNNAFTGDANGGNVTISDSTVNTVYGGRSGSGSANDNIVTISGSTVKSSVYGGYSSGSANSNIVTISGGTVKSQVYGGRSGSGSANDNIVTISDGTVKSSVYGGFLTKGSADENEIYISGGTVEKDVYGGYLGSSGDANGNIVTISSGTIKGSVYGGNATNANGNSVTISGGTVEKDVYGGYSYRGDTANNNSITISGGTLGSSDKTVIVYGGYSYMGDTANDNSVTISGNADITNASLYGSNKTDATGNTFTIDGWSGCTQSLKNFSDINFNNVNWKNGETILTITSGQEGNLANTNINLNSIAGGSSIKAGDKMTFIASNTNLSDEVNYNINDTFTAGVALEGTGTTSVDNEDKVSFTVNNLKASSQAVSAAQTRAASAAFVNQGTDLISDSLDTISRDDNYGVKTFAAVHGNRSKYDVADDIKINGWSTIVGVGNADKFDNGSELSWGVFYENGSGNYRTYNSFNNEFFRGDGSMVYNGGGIAARYENKNGVYTEGSLRAGMLKNELDNAMRNVNGSYGYETESAYYGAHIGVGKIISLSDSSDLDIYGKFFHTYTEGDSVTIADDKFDFDSITSDRLRVGARITSNKENKFSTYYGLAYEYEFNGDADMTAQGLRADTQSLQGSSVMAEVGFNYQPTPDSPWSFDLNMRGYTGERQGGSFNVQATYTF